MKTKAKKSTRMPHKNNQTTGVLDNPVQVNFTDVQKAKVEAAAKAAGLSLAGFIRQAAVLAAVKSP